MISVRWMILGALASFAAGLVVPPIDAAAASALSPIVHHTAATAAAPKATR